MRYRMVRRLTRWSGLPTRFSCSASLKQNRNSNERLHKCLRTKIKMDSTQNLCSNCGKCFSSIAKLKKHTKQVHDLSPISCKEYGKRCFGKMQHDTHIKSHQSFSCGTCLKTVPKNSRSLHKVQCKGLALDCNVCAYSTVRPDLLKLHMKKQSLLLTCRMQKCGIW